MVIIFFLIFSLPIWALFLCIYLFCRRHVKAPFKRMLISPEDEYPVTQSRWHTGCTYLLRTLQISAFILPVPIVVAGRWNIRASIFWLLAANVLASLGAFLWGVFVPQKYHDGQIRGNASRIIALLGMSLSLGVLLLCGYGIADTICISGLNGDRTYEIRLDAYSEKEFKRINAFMAWKMIPQDATDITVKYHPSFMWGAHCDTECKVDSDGLQKFAREKGWIFSEFDEADWSIVDGQIIEKRPEDLPKLRVIDRAPNGGGFTLIYNPNTQILSGNWSSN